MAATVAAVVLAMGRVAGRSAAPHRVICGVVEARSGARTAGSSPARIFLSHEFQVRAEGNRHCKAHHSDRERVFGFLCATSLFQTSLFQCERPRCHRSRSSSSRGDSGSACGAAVTNGVDEISTENDDCYGTGDGPVRATVRSEPFVKPFAQHVPVAPNNRGGIHLRRSFCCVSGKRPRT
jgi:hypothetical protein